MIQFKKIRFKNFQSVGNSFIEIYLDKSHTTLISGLNGSGKSNLLEALSYCLFGKSLKKVVLSELINSINKKNLLTEVEFITNGHEYKIIRGEKPKILEFYRDNQLINQESASKDTQSQIEYILGFDYKIFCQMVVINKVRYIPFMDQTPSIRRKVIEDILDISILSVVNDIAKTNYSDLTQRLTNIEYERIKLIERRNGVQRLIDQQRTILEQQQNDIDNEISKFKLKLNEHITKIEQLKEKKTILTDNSKTIDYSKIDKKQKELYNFEAIFKSKLHDGNSLKLFFDKNSNCPTCKQNILDSHKNNILIDINKGIDSNTLLIDEIKNEILIVKNKLDNFNILSNDIKECNNEIDNETKFLKMCFSSIESLKKSKNENNVNVDYKDELKDLNLKITEFENTYMDITEQQNYYKDIITSLKDTGVKSIIISEYIDFINRKINEYLKAMEFWCVVILDENFNETIQLGQREKVSYDSFSTGQQTRLNIAIFLALTEVANIKNSVSTNLIMLDEILENVDASGVESLIKLFNNVLSNKNIFVVSQRAEEFRDYFRSEISFELDDNDFTKIV